MSKNEELSQAMGKTKYQALIECFHDAVNDAIKFPSGQLDAIKKDIFTFKRIKATPVGFNSGMMLKGVVEFSLNNKDYEVLITHSNWDTVITNYSVQESKFLINPHLNTSAKACVCDWEIVKRSGCKCGAITPYKPRY